MSIESGRKGSFKDFLQIGRAFLAGQPSAKITTAPEQAVAPLVAPPAAVPATKPVGTPVSLPPERSPNGELAQYPPAAKWDDWTEYDAKLWPQKVPRRYMLVPTTCFNCESACGLLAYVDKETMKVRRFEGNPAHPGSRGRNCAKGPATLNQITDPERILYPMRRVGERGSGKWKRISWDEALDDIAGRIRKAILEDRKTEVMYHVGRPGEDGYMERVLQSWGVDGHNSHTNICSSGGRFGYAAWMGFDRPSPDHANARFILLISAHLESGHYFNPHAQRIMEGKMAGAKLAVMDPRLSNTASMADYWMPTRPGSEAAVLLALANQLIQNNWFNVEFVRKWTNWEQYMKEEQPDLPPTFEVFLGLLKQMYADYTPEFAAHESGVSAEMIQEIAREIARAGTAFSTHNWRAAAAGNLGGWLVPRALFFLNVLTGSIGTEGGTSANVWNKFVPRPFKEPPKQKVWNELTWAIEYPLAHHEMSFLLPHFLKEGRGKLAMYFTRVYNPVWTNPDGFTWMEVLKNETLVECHAALTPTWNETSWLADYVLPMGHSSERHDTHSYETHSAQWIAFRQPVLRAALGRLGKQIDDTREVNPGEVWEEDEFWVALSWRIDPDGSLGIREYYESPYRPGQKITMDEYYRYIFENSVPGLPEAAKAEGLTPLEYMRRYGAFEIRSNIRTPFQHEVNPADLANAHIDEKGVIWSKNPRPHSVDITPRPAQPAGEHGVAVGVMVEGKAYAGFPTPSGKLEFFSKTLKEWGWSEYALPTYERSHVDWHSMNHAANEFALVPTFRLPTLIHTRSGNAKWLNEISHSNPVWLNPADAHRMGVSTGDLVRVTTEIGYFVAKIWVTNGIAPGVLACSHHMGRWRVTEENGTDRWVSGLVDLQQNGSGWKLRQIKGVAPFQSDDPDSERIWWTDAGVHQNLTFPVHPDPVSGAHCWHQKVVLEKARPTDQYGDVFVDTAKAHQVYKNWLALARPANHPSGLRRPIWLLRPYKPDPSAFRRP
jgi:anaerobic selenocysteine-containing dehydrogenase